MTTDIEPEEDAAVRIAALREAYQARLPARMDALQALAERADNNPDDRAARESLQHQLHKLAGSGGSYGLTSLSLQARRLEEQLLRWLNAHDKQQPSGKWPAVVPQVARMRRAATSTPMAGGDSLTPASRRIPPQDGRAMRVWLIDDDPEFSTQLADQFAPFGYSLTRFANARDVLAAARIDAPDMLIATLRPADESYDISDVGLLSGTFGADGHPLIIISTYDEFQLRMRAARLGAHGFFVKPPDVPQLANWMAQFFEHRQADAERVLIVDDDRDLGEYYRLVLSRAGIEADMLRFPERIIERVGSFHPDLILMDIHMPLYTGPELAAIIRQHDHWASLPIVFLSAESNRDRQIQAMGSGADDFLTKPISDHQLVSAVRSRIERAHKLNNQIVRDSLTGLLKHASIKEAADVALARAHRSGQPVSFAMVDIDEFKAVNDTYGHAAGDVVISSIAMMLRQRLRQSDVIGRYGGEEFVAVLPECNSESARLLMNDIRERVATVRFRHHGKVFSCSISIGIACSAHHAGFNSAELLAVADQALYAAKRSGRNRVNTAAPILHKPKKIS